MPCQNNGMANGILINLDHSDISEVSFSRNPSIVSRADTHVSSVESESMTDRDKRSVGTQYNWFLLNAPRKSDKGISANPKTRSVTTQYPEGIHRASSKATGTQVSVGQKTVASQTSTARTKTAGTQVTASTKSTATQIAPEQESKDTATISSRQLAEPTPGPWVPLSKREIVRFSKGTQCNFGVRQQCVKVTQTTKTPSESKGSQCGGDLCNIHVQGTCLEQALYVLRTTQDFWILAYEVKRYPETTLLAITRPDLFGACKYDLEPICITLNDNGDCTVNKLFVPLEVENINKNPYELNVDRFMDILKPLCSTTLTLCTGIPEQYVDANSSTLVETTTIPVTRHQSHKCLRWHERKHSDTCLYCKYLIRSIRRIKKRKTLETPSRKLRRRLIASNYSIKRLTPASKHIRQNRLRTARHYAKAKLVKFESLLKLKEMTLNAEQSQEMSEIIKTIDADYPMDLNEVIDSTDIDNEKKQILRNIWKKDSEARQAEAKQSFFKDQKTNITHCRANKWSSITYRIALAVYCRSPAAYNALKDFEILQLPSVRSLQSRTATYLDNPGINHAYLKQQAEKYSEMKKEKGSRGEKVPFGEGVLIFDEVKVIDKVMWNSRNHEFIGLAMTPEDFPYLNDIFLSESTEDDKTPKAANYMLQFVWRDLASKFDVIGPYFSCRVSLEHKFILGCVLETMRVFHAYGFNVKCIVCDGASENLALIKTTMELKGVFGFKKLADNTYDFDIKPCFDNPFLPDSKCFWIICPSHQLKNMISALHSSRDNSTKNFVQNGHRVTWEQIKSVKSREEDRFNCGQVRFVPGLLDSYIIRDSWTRLNVKPSKIMQQEPLMSELFTHSQAGLPDSGSALETYRYLKACNNLFENGFLSKQKVDSLDSPQLQSILEGYEYFVDWLTEILTEDPEYKLNSNKQSKFLAWQTWDLLRICVFGIKGLAEDFLQNHPGYFLVLGRINGSVVESLFSQFKYATGSKLSSANYAQARRSVIMKSNVSAGHSSNVDYRDVELNITEHNV